MEINTDYVELALGVESPRDKITGWYVEGIHYLEEAVGTIDSLKVFLNSIERIANTAEVKDERISGSKGNLKEMKAYPSIQEVIEFVKNNKLTSIVPFKELCTIHDKLIAYAAMYKAGYEQNISIIKLEYENAAYLLISGLTMIMTAEIEFKGYGSKFKVVRKKSKTAGVLYDTIKKMAKEISSKAHTSYLQSLIEASIKEKVKPSPVKESAIYEANLPAASDIATILDNIKAIGKGGITLFKRIKASLFGIIPLIRSCIYLRYKKKADTIQALEAQAAYIRQNVEILRNKKKMDPKSKQEIIKKQEAIAAAYLKKAEKLRAELCEGEVEAKKAADADSGKVATPVPSSSPKSREDSTPDDNNQDFVLEAYDDLGYEIIPADMPLPKTESNDIGDMDLGGDEYDEIYLTSEKRVIDDSYFESVSGEKQVALYKRLCRNVKGSDGRSLRSVIGGDKDLEIKRLIKQYVDNGVPEEKAIADIIVRYKLQPVGVSGNTARPKKQNIDATSVKVEIVNLISPKNSRGEITSGMGGALEALENMLNIKGPVLMKSRELNKRIETFMNKHPELDTKDKVAVSFLTHVGAVKPAGGNTYRQTNTWKKYMGEVCKSRGVSFP